MKLILAVIQADDAGKVTQAMNEAGFRVTRIATQGGWLRRENSTLLMVVEDAQVEQVLHLLRNHAQRRIVPVHLPAESDGMAGMIGLPVMPVEVDVGGATVFVLDVERVARIASIRG